MHSPNFQVFASTAALLVLLLPFSSCSPVAERSALTPAGPRPISNIHGVPAGGHVAHVGPDVHVVNPDGGVGHVDRNPQESSANIPASPGHGPPSKRDFASGWVAYAYWYNTGSAPISSFATTWTVPPEPATNHGQTVFLFNSIEPANGNAIIQPVLQWGPSAAGGGAYWSVASWYLVGSQVYYSPLVRTSPGTVLNGLITLTGVSGSSFNYLSIFTGIGATSLPVVGATQLVWATETLESYGVTNAADYPTGSTVFSKININVSSGKPPVVWSAVSDAADGVTTTINKNSALGARITIDY